MMTVTEIVRRMGTSHRERQVITQLDADGTRKRATFGQVVERAGMLAAGLKSLGVTHGDRVATYMWNTQEHLEAYLAVPCLGAVLHTLNVRLSAEQVAQTIRHAGDRVLIVDESLLEAMTTIAPLLDCVEHFIVVGRAAESRLPHATEYHDLLDDAATGGPSRAVAENDAAALCYTSGTTGDPKGVLYTHRTLCLHALMMSGHDTYRMSEGDRVLAAVPMFHAMGWNLPYIAALIGCDLIMPGRFLQSEHLARLIAEERVTASCGVPTIWVDLLRYADAHDTDLSSLHTAVCGGSQVPLALMREYDRRHGVQIIQGWGMTETLPGAALAHDPPGADDEERWARRSLAGRVSPFYEVRTVDEGGTVLPSDGTAIGEIEIRGPTVATEYYRNPRGSAECFHDGWLRTGDIGSIDEAGWLTIADRLKDVIKSGGEWIPSASLESLLMEHPSVSEAAVIALPDERWGERPLACVVARDVDAREVIRFLSLRVAKWWLPDEVSFLDEIPKTSVGKFDKKLLRDMLADGRLPNRQRIRL
jgi:fatty-acyl-CoA synthase